MEPGKRPLDPFRRTTESPRSPARSASARRCRTRACGARRRGGPCRGRVNGGDCLGRNVHDVRLEARGRADRLRDLIPRQREARREVEALADGVSVPEQPGERARSRCRVSTSRASCRRRARSSASLAAPGRRSCSPRRRRRWECASRRSCVPVARSSTGNPFRGEGCPRGRSCRSRTASPGSQAALFDQPVRRRRLLVGGRRADEHVLGDDSREKLDFRREMLAAATAGASRMSAWIERTSPGVSLCPRLSSVRSTPRWVRSCVTASDVAGAADRENAHVHDVIGVG